MEPETMKKVNSCRFRKVSDDFDNTKFISIIFQRVGKFKYLKLIMLKSKKQTKGSGDEEEDIIVIQRKEKFTYGEVSDFLGKKDVESGAIIDLEEIKDTLIVTDKEFRVACNKGSRKCYTFARIFLFMEVICKFIEIFIFVVIPLYIDFKISLNAMISILCIFFPIALSQVVCDWSKLSEKYSRICFEFAKLANSKDEKRIEKYQSLVNSYKGGLIHSDIIAELEI